MNEYDDLLAAEEARLKPAGRQDDYDEIIAGEDATARQRLTASLVQAKQTKPDAYAKAVQTAGAIGAPPAAVESAPDDADLALVRKQADDILKNSPVLARQLGSPDFAKLAHDDTENLSLTEQIVNGFKRGWRTLLQTPGVVNIQSAGANVATLDAIDQDRKIMPGLRGADPLGMRFDTTPDLRERMRAERLASAGESAGRVATLELEKRDIPTDPVVQAAMNAKSFSEFWYYFRQKPVDFIAATGAESLPASAPGMVAAIPASMAGGPVGAATAIGSGSLITDYASTVMQALQDEGIDISNREAIAKAVQDGALMQRVGARAAAHSLGVAAFDALSGGAAGKSLAPAAMRPGMRHATNLALQAPVQGTLGALGEATGSIMAGQPINAGDVMAEFFGEFAGTPGEVLSASGGKILERVRAAEGAANDARALQQLAALREASKVAERNPQTFADFVNAAAEEGPVQDVYVDARRLLETLQQSGVPETQLPPSVQTQLPDALKTGGDVQIPLGDYAARLAASPAGQTLLQHLKTAPEGMSQAEAQHFLEQQANTFKAEAEQILATPEHNPEVRAQADAVQQHFAEQLAKANRFTPQVNEAYATLMRDFYVTMARRLGITPAEMLQRYPLQVAAERIVGGMALEQREQQAFSRAEVEQALGSYDAFKTLLSKTGGILPRFLPERGRFGNDEAYNYVQAKGEFAFGSRDQAAQYARGLELGEGGKWEAMQDGRFWRVERVGAPTDKAIGIVGEQKFQELGERALLEERGRQAASGKTDITPEQRDAVIDQLARRIVENAGDLPGTFEQASRGQISFGKDIKQGAAITLHKNADLSTFLHESGHFFLEVLNSIAASPDAPAQIREDMSATLAWMGVKADEKGVKDGKPAHRSALEVWNAMTLDEKRPFHEQFARGFEAYLFEGKAPNLEVQSLFSRFRAWLINVYKSLTALNVELSDEVRGVMNRLVASDEEIASAQAFHGMAPMFKSATEARASEAEWKAYQEQGAEATDDAKRQLEKRTLADMKWMRGARARVLKNLQAEATDRRAAIEKEVTAEVRREPVYAVQRFLRAGELPEMKRTNAERAALDKLAGAPTKLSLKALKEMYGEGPAAPWRYLPVGDHGLAATDGVHPDLVAGIFGFSSGDEMVRAILDAEPEASVIEGMTDQRMLERHGDLVDQQSLEKAADKAVHNEARARFIAAELRFLERAANVSEPTGRTDAKGRPTYVNVLAKAAKAFATQIINGKRVRDVRPAQYSAAEARAARAAFLAKNAREKIVEKRNQLVNNYAARIADGALADIEKGLRYLRKFDSDATRKSVDAEYLDQIDQLLERFDIRRATQKEVERRESLAAWVKAQEEQGFSPEIDADLLAEARRLHYSQMTVEQFRGLVDAVKNIEHLGRLKRKLLTAQDKREFAAVVTELSDSIKANAKGTVAERKSSDRGALVSIGSLFRNFMADHRKLASLAREMDGWKDAGPLWERVIRTMNTAGNHEAVMRERATMRLGELFKPILGTKLGEKTHVPAINKSLTREERLGVALNMGNEVNRERVMTGEKWTAAQVNAILDTLSKPEWDFVQSVWNYLDSFRPEIAAKQERVTGVKPEWVEAQPVVTKHGVYKGGYYPIKYDPLRSSRAEADTAAEVQRQIERGLYTQAQTRRGHLKERVKSTGRPMRYDLGVVSQHVDQVIHDLAWHEFLIDANRLLRADAVDGAIREHYGPEKLRTMKDTLRDIAVGEVGAQTAGDRVLNYLRHGSTIVGLGWRLTTALMQPLGLTQSASRIGTKWVLKGAAHWFGDAVSLESSYKKISEKSDFMRLRAKTMQREINEIRNKVATNAGDGSISLKGAVSKVAGEAAGEAVEGSYFYMIAKMQLVADVPTWWGAYEKAMHQNGMNEDKAIALADQAVRDAQGAGQTGDLAGVQRGSPARKLFTNFYSFFNTTYNLTVEAFGRTNFKSPKSVALLAADMALLYTIPALMGTLIKSGLKGDWDEDKFWRRLIADQLNYLFGTIVMLRELGSGIQAAMGMQGADYQGPASVRFFVAVTKLAKQMEQGEADEAFWKALNEVGGLVFHYPAGQINATADGLDALASGESRNPGVLVTGAPH